MRGACIGMQCGPLRAPAQEEGGATAAGRRAAPSRLGQKVATTDPGQGQGRPPREAVVHGATHDTGRREGQGRRAAPCALGKTLVVGAATDTGAPWIATQAVAK